MRSARLSARARVIKIAFHRQLPDLGMQVMYGRVVVLLPALGRAGEQFLQTGLRLPLPAAHLIRMHLVLGCDRLDRAVSAERFHRYLGFELSCESTPCRRHSRWPSS